MARYPRAARSARIKCISCNAPVVETIDGGYACVGCGDSPISATDPDDAERSASQRAVIEPAGEDGADVAGDERLVDGD